MKITKSKLVQIIKEEIENLASELSDADRDDRLMELLGSAKVYRNLRGVYFTTAKAFLKAVRDMAALAQETKDLEQSLRQIEADVDAGKYMAAEIHRALQAGQLITGGVYATSRDSFLKAMTDAAKAAMEGMTPDEVAKKIESNVDMGKYSDPKVRDVIRNLTRTRQPFTIGRK
tara:strand:+ start:407 stop:928 length:522 start_codon:yes stop_codon:yes gene_type:complete